jgi:WD40 repeat protein
LRHWIVEYRLVTGKQDGTVCVWNVRTGECTHTLKGHTSDVYCVAFDGTTIVSGSDDKTVRIWRAPYNTCERVMEEGADKMHRMWLCTALNEHIVVRVDVYSRVHVHDIRTSDRMCAPIDCLFCKLS